MTRRRINNRLVPVARDLGFGVEDPSGRGWLFTKDEETTAQAEASRRYAERKAVLTAIGERAAEAATTELGVQVVDYEDELRAIEYSLEETSLALFEMGRQVRMLTLLVRSAMWSRAADRVQGC